MIEIDERIDSAVIRRANRGEPVSSLAERIGPRCPLCAGETTVRLVLRARSVALSERVCLACETVTARRFGPKERGSIEARGECGHVAARLMRGHPGCARIVVRKDLFAPIAVEEGRGALGAWIHGVLGQMAALFTLPELRR